jgi:tetratricopeptide (TPR) repeat protein
VIGALSLFTAAAALSPEAAAAGGGVAPPSSARSLVLTPSQMFKLAELAKAKGDLATATAILVALESNPDADIRAEARYRHAKQYLAEKKYREAAVLLRRILDDKPNAAPVRLELAHVLDTMGDKDGALRELRAAQSGGLPPAVARLVDRYSTALRAAKSVGASIEIAVAPDSNINRATRSDTLGTVFGDFDVTEDSKARSGTGLALRGQTFRRFGIGGDDSMLVRLSGFGDLYTKGRFNDIALDLAAGPELRLGRYQVNLEAGATQRWYGQHPFMRAERIAATVTHPLGTRAQLRLNGSAGLIDNLVNQAQDGKSFSGKIAVERAMSPTTGLGINVGADRQSLKDPGYSTTSWRAGLIGWHELGRMTLTAEAEYGRLHADERLFLFPEKRADRYSRLSLAATFRQLQWRGFAPVARFTIERNKSSVEFYDYRRTRSEIGIVRAF